MFRCNSRCKALFVAAALAASTAALADRPMPGLDLMAPGSNVVGTPDYGKDVKIIGAAEIPSPDKNGDGFLDPSELDPNSQLSKRLATRDANRDGKLSRDEYYFK